MQLDHIVIHVENAEEIQQLKHDLDSLDIPFEPTWGKKAKGFKVSNIWLGQQYFEIVDILDADNLWQPQWSLRHAQGDRGVYCVFLKINQDIHRVHKDLKDAGIKLSEPERTSFKWMFGLLKKKLPWQFILLPRVPGTSIEIGLIQYDSGAEEKFERFMTPNTKDKGITGLSKASIYSNQIDEARAYLENISRHLGQELPIKLNDESQAVLLLQAELEANTSFTGFKVANVSVVP